MRKMTEDDVAQVVRLLKQWKRGPLFWDALRRRISEVIMGGGEAWSRQSLQKNDDINKEWLATRKRLASRRAQPGSAAADDVAGNEAGQEPSEVERLQQALDKLQAKYDDLAIRHRQLVHNASMLPGGTRLLLDPLPDNTPVQKAGTGSRRSTRG